MNKLISIIDDLELKEVEVIYSNETINYIFANTLSYYTELICENFSIPYPFFINFTKPKLIVNNLKLYIKLFDDIDILNYINEVSSYNLQELKNYRNLNSINDIKEKFPFVYYIYNSVMKSYDLKNNAYLKDDKFFEKLVLYKNNLQVFLEDISEFLEILLTNKEKINDLFDKKLYELELKTDEQYKGGPDDIYNRYAYAKDAIQQFITA